MRAVTDHLRMARIETNDDTAAALRYHEATKHSLAKLRATVHTLDWSNHPLPFKIYRDVESLPLPADAELLTGGTPPALEAVAAEHSGDRVPDLATLARVLYLAAGITKRRQHPGGEVYFRAYANTGALYHIDLYAVTGELADLPAGVYHFGPNDFALHRLRRGDYRSVVAAASGEHARIAHAPVVLVSASTYWRNAWKYRARTYRHCFWDTGTLHANLLAIAAAEGLRPLVVLGFVDAMVTELLGLDAEREAPLTLVPLGRSEAPPPRAPPMSELALECEPLSRTEVDYPDIRHMQAASSLATERAVAAWRDAPAPRRTVAAAGETYPIEPLTGDAAPRRSLADVIRRRGSTRAFDRTRAISFPQLSTVLDRATGGLAADFLEPPGSTLLDLYVIVNAVEDLPAGAYYYRRDERSLELLRRGDHRHEAGALALGQSLAADAAVNVYSLCTLSEVLERYGNRGYRAAQLEGGITGGRMYIAAYAQRLGATGLTFFDDDVTAFFSPHAAGKSVMFLVALGHPDRSALGLSG